MTATLPTTPPADERIAELRGQIDQCDAEIIALVHRHADFPPADQRRS